MSDNLLIVIPRDPLAIPSATRLEAARALIAGLCDAEQVTVQMAATPNFYSCMEGFEGVFCPVCKAALPMPWWRDQMNRWWNGDRRDLRTTLPCCNAVTSLNDLDDQGAQGFACAAIEAMNPERDLKSDELQQIEAALGLPVRVIWARI